MVVHENDKMLFLPYTIGVPKKCPKCPNFTALQHHAQLRGLCSCA